MAENRAIVCLTDGKIGDRVQCLGIARALQQSPVELVVSPRKIYTFMAPWGPADPQDWARVQRVAGQQRGPIVLASGRRAIPVVRMLKANHPDAIVVILKEPRLRAAFADLVWTPEHDRQTGATRLRTLTSPHGLSEELAKAPQLAAIKALPRPLLGVALGGPSGGARFDRQDAERFCDMVEAAAKDYAALAVTPSRRTPQLFIDVVHRRLMGEGRFVWDREGENPYLDILRASDALVVTADSHNMMSEAVSTKAGVYAFRPAGLAKKLGWFVDRLENMGRVRPFVGEAPVFTADPIDATLEIAQAIKAKISDQRQANGASG